MSFQDYLNGGRTSSSTSSATSNSPSQAVAAGIFQIHTAVSVLRRLINAIGTIKDTADHRQKLHNTSQHILQLVKDTSTKLKLLGDSDHQTNPAMKVEYVKLARDFHATLQEFQEVQQLASERESTYIPQAPPSALKVTWTSYDESAEHPPAVNQENHPFLIEQKRQELLLHDNEIAFNEALADEREQGRREIEAQIGEVNEIFKDFSILVHNQGVVIDDIQSTIDASSAATSQARTQLVKSSKSVKSRCSWCWWMLGILVVALVVFFLFLII